MMRCIGINQGTIDAAQPRSELQGVVAHEFSHILNGDMRNINLRLIALLHGILFLGMIGYGIAARQHARSLAAATGEGIGPWYSSSPYRPDSSSATVALSSAIWIKAAVSRQREYLADASAVQFTRNPQRHCRRAEKDRRLTPYGSAMTSPASLKKPATCSSVTCCVRSFGGLYHGHPPAAGAAYTGYRAQLEWPLC